MSKDIILKFLKMTEEELVQEASKFDLTIKELETFDKGKEFDEKLRELDDNSKRRGLSSLVLYALTNKNGGR